MKVYLVSIGEPLPTDEGAPKMFRTGTLFRYLLEQGHEVTWWTSSFNHSLKEQRCEQDIEDKVGEQGKIIKLYAPGYKKSVSIMRFLNHFLLGRKFAKYLKDAMDGPNKPDIVIASFPAIELAYYAVSAAKKQNLPCIVDARDMWPDTIFNQFSNPVLNFAARNLLHHLTWMTKYSFQNADSIIGITDGFVEWAQKYAIGRDCSRDESFPLTSKIRVDDDGALLDAHRYWDGIVPKNEESLTICFFGVISDRKFDFQTVLKASEQLLKEGHKVRFILCGLGDSYEKYKAINNSSNVVFPGWVDAPKILALLARADVGLCPYYSSEDFKISIPIKFFEYMSMGVPVLSCLQGGARDLVEGNNIGLMYEVGDAQTLVTAVLRMIEEPTFRCYCSARSKKLYSERFEEEKIFARLTSHIESFTRTV